MGFDRGVQDGKGFRKLYMVRARASAFTAETCLARLLVRG